MAYEEKLKQALYQEYLIERERLEQGRTTNRTSTQDSHEKRLQPQGRTLTNNEQYLNPSRVQVNQPTLPVIANTISAIEEYNLYRFDKDSKIHVLEEREEEEMAEELAAEEEHYQQLSQYFSNSNITGVTNNNTSHFSSSLATKSKSNDTSTYKNIKFTKVTDPSELQRFNAIFEDPNTPHIKNKKDGDRILSTFELPNGSVASIAISPKVLQNDNDNSNKTISNNPNRISVNLNNQSNSNLNGSNNNLNTNGGVTLTASTTGSQQQTKQADVVLLNASKEKIGLGNDQSPIVPSVTTDYIIRKPNNEFVRKRYVEDLRSVGAPSKNEKVIYDPKNANNNVQTRLSHHHHQNRSQHNHSSRHQSEYIRNNTATPQSRQSQHRPFSTSSIKTASRNY